MHPKSAVSLRDGLLTIVLIGDPIIKILKSIGGKYGLVTNIGFSNRFI